MESCNERCTSLLEDPPNSNIQKIFNPRPSEQPLTPTQSNEGYIPSDEDPDEYQDYDMRKVGIRVPGTKHGYSVKNQKRIGYVVEKRAEQSAASRAGAQGGTEV